MEKLSIIGEVFCLILYALVATLGVLIEVHPLQSIWLAALYGVCGVLNLIFDTDFRAKKIRPTARTIGLFVLVIVFIYLAFN